jgi:hypothetical protein
MNTADLGAGHTCTEFDPFFAGCPLRRNGFTAKDTLVKAGKLLPIGGDYIRMLIFCFHHLN